MQCILAQYKDIQVIFNDFKGILHILRIQWYLGHFKSFCSYFGHFGVKRSFARVCGYFGYSWCILVILVVLRGLFQTFWCIYRLFDILEIFPGKIIVLTKKAHRNHQNDLYTPKIAKYQKKPQNISNKFPPTSLNCPKLPKSSK